MVISKEECRESSFENQWVALCPIDPLRKRLVLFRAGHLMLPSLSYHEVGCCFWSYQEIGA